MDVTQGINTSLCNPLLHSLACLYLAFSTPNTGCEVLGQDMLSNPGYISCQNSDFWNQASTETISDLLLCSKREQACSMTVCTMPGEGTESNSQTTCH